MRGNDQFFSKKVVWKIDKSIIVSCYFPSYSLNISILTNAASVRTFTNRVFRVIRYIKTWIDTRELEFYENVYTDNNRRTDYTTEPRTSLRNRYIPYFGHLSTEFKGRRRNGFSHKGRLRTYCRDACLRFVYVDGVARVKIRIGEYRRSPTIVDKLTSLKVVRTAEEIAANTYTRFRFDFDKDNWCR